MPQYLCICGTYKTDLLYMYTFVLVVFPCYTVCYTACTTSPPPPQIVQGCVFCLGAVVNNVTHNYHLVKETFMKFFGKFFFSLNINLKNIAELITLLFFG